MPTLPDIAQVVSIMLADFDLIDTKWEDVTTDGILLIYDKLIEQLPAFKNLVLEDMRLGGHGCSCVVEINLTLTKYVRWMEPSSNLIWSTESMPEDECKKIRSAKALLEFIALEWITWAEVNYTPIRGKAEEGPRMFTEEERERYKDEKMENLLSKESNELLKHVIADNYDQKLRYGEAIAEAVRGKGGKEAAEILVAATRLKILSRLPNFRLMKKFWGVIGVQSSISEYYNDNEPLKAVSENIVEMWMASLREKLHL